MIEPTENEKDAEEWTARMAKIYKDTRRWLIMPVSDPTVVNKLDPEVN